MPGEGFKKNRKLTSRSNFTTGKAATDFRPLVVNTTSVLFQELTAVFNEQIVLPVEEKLQSGCAEFLQSAVLLRCQLDARKSPTAVRSTASAALTADDRLVRQDPMLYYPLLSEQIHPEPP